MIRRLCVVPLVALSLVVAAGAAQAQSKPLAFGIGAGLSQPFGDFGDAAKLGFAFAGTVERPFDDRFALGGELLIDRHSAKDLPRALGGGNVDGSFTTIGVSPYLSYTMGGESKQHPFVRGGLGVYHTRTSIKATSVLPEQSESSTDFGMRVGGGIQTAVSSAFTLGASADYHAVFTEGATSSFIVLGVFARFGGAD